MDVDFDNKTRELLGTANSLLAAFRLSESNGSASDLIPPESFKMDFFHLVDQVNLSLMEDSDNFYGYFVFQMSRELRFDIGSATAVNFKGTGYVIYYNPLLFLTFGRDQMAASIKHEILHILSLHLLRARDLKGRYSKLAVNTAMDIVVNKYLNELPPYAITLERVNLQYSLTLEPYASFEYYVEKLQTAIDLLSVEDNNDQGSEASFDPERTHDIWDESDEQDGNLVQEFTEKAVRIAEKGGIPAYLQGMLEALKSSRGELPWNLYLKRLLGTVESNKKKTITRRDRRQPDRVDLRGQLRSHRAKVAVAVDISGSISDGEFKQALIEVLSIIKNYSHDITVVECDNEIRREYKVNSLKDIKDRSHAKGGTSFSPVFDYANHHKLNLLVYFTDGKGEERLTTVPHGYRILWVLSGEGDELSLKEPYGAVKKLSRLTKEEEILSPIDVPSGGFSMNNQEKMV